jgi:TPR repeat protein
MTLRNADEQGSPKAQDLLGIAYERGAGIKQSYAEALRFSSGLRF